MISGASEKDVYILIAGWWFFPTPLKNMKVVRQWGWDDIPYPIYDGKYHQSDESHFTGENKMIHHEHRSKWFPETRCEPNGPGLNASTERRTQMCGPIKFLRFGKDKLGR